MAAVKAALEQRRDDASLTMSYASIEEVNRLFTRRGIVYRISEYGRAEWVDEPEIRPRIV